MSDMANTYYNAWVELGGYVKSRRVCEWHVYKAWSTNFPNIKGTTEEKALVLEHFKLLQKIPDSNTFD